MSFSSRLETVLSFAARLHAKQKRKGTRIPYVSHLLGTACIAMEHGANEDEAIAALLHDAIEDQGSEATENVIQILFGKKVASIVRQCTGGNSKSGKSWRNRKQIYLDHLKIASRSARLVSASDKLHNAGCIVRDYRRHGEKFWKRFDSKPEEILWYYRSLVGIYQEYGPKDMAGELDELVTEMERLAKE